VRGKCQQRRVAPQSLNTRPPERAIISSHYAMRRTLWMSAKCTENGVADDVPAHLIISHCHYAASLFL
jgi:hypothetical protein